MGGMKRKRKGGASLIIHSTKVVIIRKMSEN